jgi:PKD repeat protein
VAFTSTSTDPDGTIDSYAWDFGDNNTSTLANPVHAYATGGIYTVTLTVTDNDNATDTTTKQVTVTAPPTPNEPPTADFTSVATDLSVAFTSASTDPDGTIDSYAWDFGDDNTSTLANPVHAYTTGGIYTVTLTVTDNDNATDTTTKQVTVTAPPTPNEPPTADFTSVATDLSVAFTSASTDPDGTIDSYAWDFGDDNTSTLANPVHAYDHRRHLHRHAHRHRQRQRHRYHHQASHRHRPADTERATDG